MAVRMDRVTKWQGLRAAGLRVSVRRCAKVPLCECKCAVCESASVQRQRQRPVSEAARYREGATKCQLCRCAGDGYRRSRHRS